MLLETSASSGISSAFPGEAQNRQSPVPMLEVKDSSKNHCFPMPAI